MNSSSVNSVASLLGTPCQNHGNVPVIIILLTGNPLMRWLAQKLLFLWDLSFACWVFDIQNTDFQLSIDLELLGFADIRELCKKPESSLLRLPRL